MTPSPLKEFGGTPLSQSSLESLPSFPSSLWPKVVTPKSPRGNGFMTTPSRENTAKRLRRAGWLFLLLGAIVGGGCWALTQWPPDVSPWLEARFLPSDPNNCATYYVFSLLFGLMGLCCLGGAWQRTHLIRK